MKNITNNILNNILNKAVVIILFTSFLSFTGCSSIFNGSMATVAINSNPSSATVKINGMDAGATPTKIRLKRGETHIIEIKKEGYLDYKVITNKSIAGLFWVNIICGGLIGIFIDAATGNMYDVEPRIINANLTKDTSFNFENNNNEFDNDYTSKYVMGEFESIQLRDENNNIVGNIQITWE